MEPYYPNHLRGVTDPSDEDILRAELKDAREKLATARASGDLKRLREANEQRQKEWDPGDVITAVYRGNELAGEVGEVCNVVKKLERERLGIRGSRANVGQLADELADVQICLDLLAMKYDIDLWAATVSKFNRTSEANLLDTRLGLFPQSPEAKP